MSNAMPAPTAVARIRTAAAALFDGIHPHVRLRRGEESLEGLFTAAARPQDAWQHLIAGVCDSLGGPEIDFASEGVWRHYIQGSPLELATAARRVLRSALARLAEHRRRIATEHGPATPQPDGSAGAVQARLRRLEIRVGRSIAQCEQVARHSFARATERFWLWNANQLATVGRESLDARAHALAVRLALGEVQPPQALASLRVAIERSAPTLTRAEQQAVHALAALAAIDGVARQCAAAAQVSMVVSTLWQPGKRAPRRRLALQYFAEAESALRTPRARALIATAATGLLLLDVHDGVTAEAQVAPRPVDARQLIRDAGIASGVRALLQKAIQTAASPQVAHGLLDNARSLAMRERDRLERHPQGITAPASEARQAPRVATGLYLAENGRNIELGSTELRFPSGRIGRTDPVTVHNAEGRLLLWLAGDGVGRGPVMRKQSVPHLREALRNAGGRLELVATGPNLRLEPLPAFIDPRLTQREKGAPRLRK